MKRRIFLSLILIVLFLSACQQSQWNLILVNENNKVPSNINIDLIKLDNGREVDQRIYPDLQKMFDQMRAEGLDPEVTQGYRTRAYQEDLFDNEVNRLINLGYSRKDAYNQTAKSIAKPGHSEHELGLAVDIDVRNIGSDLNSVYSWLNDNAYKYGFILRYPYRKEEITGIIYEPWHYRYVGKEAARYIYENNLTLEEYLK